MKYLALVMLAVVPLFIAGAHAGEDDQKIRINLAGLDLATVAKQVEKVAKRSFLYDENLLRAKRVTLQSDTPISASEFYRVFQAVCQMNGLALIPVEGAGMTLEKIVPAQGAAKEPGAQPVLVRGDQLPSGDAIVSYLAKLQHTPATKILAVLTPSLSPTGTILQIPNTDLLMINDGASSIKRIEKLLTLLDIPGEPMTTRTVQLVNISVDKAQSLINDYQQALAKLRTGETQRDRLAIVKDERLSILHLIGTQADVKEAQEFISMIDRDSPSARRTIRYYKLKNVPVKDIVDYVGQLLGVALQTRSADLSVAPELSQVNPPGGVPPIQPTPTVPPPLSPLPIGGAKTAVNAQPSKNKNGNASAALPADIIPVEGLNTLVVAGDATVHQEVESILQNLDKRKGQVLIEVAIVQVTGDDSLDLGVEGLGLNDISAKKFFDYGTGFGIGTQSDTQSRGFPTQTVLSAVSGGAFRYVNSDNLQVVLSALAAKSNVAIVSQPQLLVNDNEEASFTTKVSEPTVTTSQNAGPTTLTGFSGFADATTSLQITPHISPDNYLNLEIVQTFEEFTGASGGNGIPPPKVSNNATTKVSIPDRQTIVIGGFTRDSSTNTRSGVPGLMQIPGIGKMFSKESKRKTTSRLYLFVRPKILSAPDFADLKKEAEQKKNDVEDLSNKSRIKQEIKEGIGRRGEIVPVPDAERSTGK